MIYLSHRFLSSPHSRECGSSCRVVAAWVSILAAAALILIFGTGNRNAVIPTADSPSFALSEQEQHRLQEFMAALRAEGAVRDVAPCRQSDICAKVTELFRSLDTSDKRSIGRSMARHFETENPEVRPIRNVLFLDVRTGVELGRYAGGRLHWKSGF